jgi:tRNA (cytidine32/uridine32-2'-O)-methyltransferase
MAPFAPSQRPQPWIVMVGTSHPGNVGATARAMKTMGLDRLRLAGPECDPSGPDAIAMAVGADDLLQGAERHPDLASALADCQLVLGCTARRRHVQLNELTPREAAARALASLPAGPVAILFGRERTGLTNEELQRCHAAVHIPTNPDFSSLNVAAAVQVMAYELRLGMLEAEMPAGRPPRASGSDEPPASHDQMERFFEHLNQALVDIEFHKGRSTDIVMRRLRRLFLRATPDQKEVRILRGILTEAQRMARLAGRDRADAPGQ